jgi:hypothetical protein
VIHDIERHGGMILTGEPKNSDKSLSQCYFSNTNPIWTGPDTNPVLRCERPATNRLTHVTAVNQTLERMFRKKETHAVARIILIFSFISLA